MNATLIIFGFFFWSNGIIASIEITSVNLNYKRRRDSTILIGRILPLLCVHVVPFLYIEYNPKGTITPTYNAVIVCSPPLPIVGPL